MFVLQQQSSNCQTTTQQDKGVSAMLVSSCVLKTRPITANLLWNQQTSLLQIEVIMIECSCMPDINCTGYLIVGILHCISRRIGQSH